MAVFRAAGFSLVIFLSGCSWSHRIRPDYSGPRFIHVDVKGPAPFVFFDQKTKQLCWADYRSNNGKPVMITVTVGEGSADANEMMVCKDLE